MSIKFEINTKMFFDKKRVLDAEERGRRRALSRFGAFVRRRARSSIRKAKKPQYGPNATPRNRTGLLKDFIFFSYDARERSVVIGPMKLNKPDTNSAQLHEFGGIHRETGKRYPRRSYMRPAFQVELEKSLDSTLRGYVR